MAPPSKARRRCRDSQNRTKRQQRRRKEEKKRKVNKEKKRSKEEVFCIMLVFITYLRIFSVRIKKFSQILTRI